jgi:hypothetical protein
MLLYFLLHLTRSVRANGDDESKRDENHVDRAVLDAKNLPWGTFLGTNMEKCNTPFKNFAFLFAATSVGKMINKVLLTKT